jgi:hypothetical protein
MPMDEAWARWSGDITKKIARLEANVAQLQEHFYGTKADLKEGKELAISRLIKGAVFEILYERKILRDVGTWDSERLYGPGAAVTDKGALWACQIECKATRPGDNACWRLMHKSDVAHLRRAVVDEVARQVNGAKR